MNEVMLPPYFIDNIMEIIPFAETTDWSLTSLDIPKFHAMGITGKEIKIAVLDTGADPKHQDLKEAITEVINVSGENLGFSNGHGTGTAAVIGARKNGNGIIGVAYDCKIIAIKVLRESGGGTYAAIIAGVEAAISKGVDIINMSLGGPSNTPALESVINKAVRRGITVICAAGNAGGTDTVSYPARYPSVIAVAATNKHKEISSFSSRGKEVDVAAPGEKIRTAWKNNTYAVVSGTSFAAPFCAGIAALMMEIDRKLTLEIIKKTAFDIDEPGFDISSGYGLINPFKMLSTPPEPTPVASITPSPTSSPTPPPTPTSSSSHLNDVTLLIEARDKINKFLLNQ